MRSANAREVGHAARVTSLDSLRGIAALIVVFHHCGFTYFAGNLPGWIKHSPLRLVFDGTGSVLVFFALSGFVLFLTFRNSDQFRYFPYIIKRFMRIYPPFAAAILGSAVLYELVRPHEIPPLGTWFNQLSWDVAPTAGVIAGHLAMTDRPNLQGLDNVMWSLGHEARISVIFPLLALCVWKNWRATVIAAMIVSFVSLHIDLKYDFRWLYDPFKTLEYLFLFAGGAAVSLNAHTVRAWLARAPRWGRSLLWVVALVCITAPETSRLGFVAASFSAILLVVLCLADPAVQGVLSGRFPRWLGQISYSLYLVHLPVLLTLVHVLWGKVPLPYILLCTVVLSLLSADIAYRMIEKPSMNLGRRLAAYRVIAITSVPEKTL